MSGLVFLVGGEQREGCRWLEESGYVVEGAADWIEIRERCRSVPAEAVLLDANQVDPADFERLAEIRTLALHTPVILLGRATSVGVATLGLELGAYDYLSLPLDPIRLRTTLRNAIERQRLRQRVARLEGERPAERRSEESEEPLLPLVEIERLAIVNALRQTRGNLSAVGRQLGIGRTTLYRKLKKYDLS